MSSDNENIESGADLASGSLTDAQIRPEVPIFRRLVPGSTQAAVPLLIGSLVALLIVILMVSFKVLVPAHVARSLQFQINSLNSKNDNLRAELELSQTKNQIQINSLRSQNDNLRAELELSQTKNKEYDAKLEGASPEQARSQIEMQATIKALEEQIETIRVAEWPPLTASAQESLYQQLRDMPAQEVWVGYADSGGRALARTFSDLFKRLDWPQKYPILAVLDPQDGLWITPISDFSEQLRDKIAQSTGLQFKLFPRRERLPDTIGVIVGYRTPNQEANEKP